MTDAPAAHKPSSAWFDGPVLFSVAARLWQLASGPVTLLLMTLCFTESMRGYFYTFSSLLALQVYFELSLHVVLISLSSHEWSKLSLGDSGRVEGDPAAMARLAALNRISRVWYGVAAGLFVALCGPLGMAFLARETLPESAWLGPWWMLVVCTGGLLALQSFTAILEGCDQLAVVNRVRLKQGVTGSVVVWALIGSGCGLWSVAGSALVRLLWELWLVTIRYRRFWNSLRETPSSGTIDWWREVWPLQWRVALQGAATWWVSSCMTPVLFHWHGDVAAGRFGMTWNILSTLQSAAGAWIDTRRPLFGQLVAQQRQAELDSMYAQALRRSLLMLSLAFGAFAIGLTGLGWIDWDLARKLEAALLPLGPTLILIAGLLAFQFPYCQTIYVRAHCRELFLIPSLLVCGLTGGLVLWLGQRHSMLGVAVAWTASIAGFQWPVWTLIFRRFRRNVG